MSQKKKQTLQRLTLNLATNMVRNEVMSDRDYLVVPMVMMVEGVHSGSNGALLYPAEELAKDAHIWNAKPIVINHPQIAGKGMTACSPEVMSAQSVGVIMNTRIDNNRLCAEAWMEKARLEKVAPAVLDAVTNHQVMEVSTGVFIDTEPTDGEWNGETYTGIARNHRPDHLAILPDTIGACSVVDGAGLCRNQKEPAKIEGLDTTKLPLGIVNMLAKSRLISNELSYGGIADQLRMLVRPQYPSTEENRVWIYIPDVFANYFIYEVESSNSYKLYRQSYIVKDDDVELVGDAEEVQRRTIYVPVNKPVENEKPQTIPTTNTQMDKTTIVNHLISTGAWNEAKRPFLMGLELNALTELKENAGTPEPKPAAVVANSVTEYVAAAPAPLKGELEGILAAHAAAKKEVIAKITANASNKFTEAALNAMPMDALQNIAALCANSQPAETPAEGAVATPAANYAGQADPAPTHNAQQGETNEPPSMWAN